MIKEQQRKNLKKRKKLDRKTFRGREISVILRAKTFTNFEVRLCLGRNFRANAKKAKIAKLSARESFCPKVLNSGIIKDFLERGPYRSPQNNRVHDDQIFLLLLPYSKDLYMLRNNVRLHGHCFIAAESIKMPGV